jgi:hypothetical protein
MNAAGLLTFIVRGLRAKDTPLARTVGHYRAPRLALGCAAVLVLAGCGGAREPAVPVPSPTVIPVPMSDAPTPVPDEQGAGAGAGVSGASIEGEVVWALQTDPGSGAPIDPVTLIDPARSRFVAAVEVRRGIDPANARAEWVYNNTPMPALAAETIVPAGDGVTWVSFGLELPPGEAWPPGQYAVSISLDGVVAATGTVDVRPSG